MRLNPKVFIIAALLLSTVFAASRPASAQGDSIVLADSGFRPGANGFKFPNYTNDINPTNMTPENMQRMFGDEVCANQNDGQCTLTPAAAEFMEQANKIMNGGHCEGMAVLSMLLYAQQKSISDLNVGDIGDLTGSDAGAQAEIAYWFTPQLTPTAQLRTYDKTPNEVVDLLIESLGGNIQDPNTVLYTIAFWAKGFTGGHAVTPYAVLDRGNNVVWIMVYDNNFPGEERHIEVDRAANTWSYNGATNPSEPATDYVGDAETKTLVLMPLQARLGLQPCTFCASSGSALNVPSNGGLFTAGFQAKAPALNSIFLNGEGNLLISNADGSQAIGYKDGKFINTFPGASFTAMVSGLNEDSAEPIYYIPVGSEFFITVDGSQLTAETNTSVEFYGPGYVLIAEDIKLAPGEQDIIGVTADGKGMTYSPSASESPTLQIGFETPSDDYSFVVKGVDMEAKGLINLSVNTEKGQLIIDTTGNTQNGTYSFEFDRIDDKTQSTFTAEEIPLAPADTLYINYGKWTGDKAALELSLDVGGDGTIDETVNLADSQ